MGAKRSTSGSSIRGKLTEHPAYVTIGAVAAIIATAGVTYGIGANQSQAEVQGLQTEVQRLEGDIGSLTSEKDELEGRVSQLNSENASLRSELDRLSAPAEVSISSPTDGELAPRETIVSGTTENWDPNKQLWILVQPQGTSLFDPQEAPVSVRADGNWTSGPIYLDDGPADTFQVLAVEATSQASAAFSAYLAEQEQTQEYPGIVMPPEAIEKDRVEVQLTG